MKASTLILGGAALFIAAPFLLWSSLGAMTWLDEQSRRELEAERMRKLEEAKKRVGITTP